MPEPNYLQESKKYPYHLSIGGVVRNERGEIACHYFKKFFHKSLGEFENFYILMRETIEPNESVEQCLARGLMEEFGIEATLRAYLGTIISHYPMLSAGVTIEKTTLYFLCDLVSSDISKRKPDDPESDSEIFWLKPEELIIKMKEQGQRLNRSDIDESPALERLLQAN